MLLMARLVVVPVSDWVAATVVPTVATQVASGVRVMAPTRETVGWCNRHFPQEVSNTVLKNFCRRCQQSVPRLTSQRS